MAVSAEERARFASLCARELGRELHTADGGIGTLSEKRMHRVLKHYVCPDSSRHEINMGGKYVADVLDGGEIYEIQTGSFYPLAKKLKYYVESTDFHVTIVHPVAAKRYLVWIDPETGEAAPRRLSPKRESAADVLPELIYIWDLLRSGRVSVRILFIEEEEYRFLNGWSKDRKRGSGRYERMPVSIGDELTLHGPSDLAVFMPEGLPEPFTAEEYGKCLHLRGRRLYMALKTLEKCGITVLSGKRGRANVWKKADT